MGFIFRKSLDLGPFRLNLSKNGLGMSVGVPGLRYTVGNRGSMLTASLPGTGISYRTSGGKRSASSVEKAPVTEKVLNARRELLEAEMRIIKEYQESLEASIARKRPMVIAGKRLQIAWLYYQAHRLEDALGELGSIDLQHPDIAMSKAMILTRLGRDGEALDCLDRIGSQSADLGSFAFDWCGLLVMGFIEKPDASDSKESVLSFSCDPEGYQVLRSWLRQENKQGAPAETAPKAPPRQVQATQGKQFAELCARLMAMVLIADGKVDEREFQYLQNRMASDPRLARYDGQGLLEMCRKQVGCSQVQKKVPVEKILASTPFDLLSASDKAEVLQMALGMAQADFKLSPEETYVIRESARILGASLPMGFDEMST